MGKWRALAVLGLAQFLMTIDTSVMNVSISTLVEDFDTDVSTIQGIITLYSLVMAAFMITGGKLGDRWGRRRAFRIGLVVYGAGSALTAAAPTVGVLAVGWSILEGLGATLVMPALAALVAGSYRGKERALAYGLIGGVAGAAVAVGPIIGGWTTTNLSWRVVFVAEVVLVLVILAGTRWLVPARADDQPPTIDLPSAGLSAAGLGLVVYGVLMSSTWGWVSPRSSPVAPFGFALTPWVILAGLVLLAVFARRQTRLADRGRTPLVRTALFSIRPLRAGLNTLTAQQTILMGIFFVLPLYLQVVLGFNAFDTGVRLLPVSVTLLVAALAGPRLAERASPRGVSRIGLGLLVVGALFLLATIEPDPAGTAFALSLAVIGTGVGLLVSQLGNVIQSAVEEEDRSEAGGLQYTAQNLGAALGTALIGAIVLGSLTATTLDAVVADSTLAQETKTAVEENLQGETSFVSLSAVERAATEAGLPEAEVTALTEIYGDAQLQALKAGLLVAAFLAVGAFWFTTDLPGREGASDATTTPTTAAPDG